jgi:hypothetical protein
VTREQLQGAINDAAVRYVLTGQVQDVAVPGTVILASEPLHLPKGVRLVDGDPVAAA